MSGAVERAAPEVVVILHGVAISSWFTARLAKIVAAAGYVVHNLDYPSKSVPLPELGPSWLAAKLGELGVARAARLHFVTHSMGGLIVRGFLAAHRPANLGRNLGALGTGPDAYWRTLPQRADFELGVIAGSSALNPLGWFFLERPHDGTVAERSTRLEGMADHILLRSNHTLILFRRRTADQAIAFLRTGRFAAKSEGGAV